MFKSPEDDSTFHAVFSTGRTGLTGSAVCSFRLQDLERTFDEGKFREQVGQNKQKLLDYFSLTCVLRFLGGKSSISMFARFFFILVHLPFWK